MLPMCPLAIGVTHEKPDRIHYLAGQCNQGVYATAMRDPLGDRDGGITRNVAAGSVVAPVLGTYPQNIP